jgi:hypothetical protein
MRRFMGKHMNGKWVSLLALFLLQLSPLLFCIVLWLSYPVPKKKYEGDEMFVWPWRTHISVVNILKLWVRWDMFLQKEKAWLSDLPFLMWHLWSTLINISHIFRLLFYPFTIVKDKQGQVVLESRSVLLNLPNVVTLYYSSSCCDECLTT